MRIALEFPHNYEVKAETESTIPLEPTFYFPSYRKPGQDVLYGICIGVSPVEADAWFGRFRYFRSNKHTEATGVYATPRPETMCVIANGSAYSVNSANPREWEIVPAYPVLEVRSVFPNNLLLLRTPHTFCALGNKGVAWRSEPLALNGLSIESIESDLLRGTATCACHDGGAGHHFELDLKTGNYAGGWERKL